MFNHFLSAVLRGGWLIDHSFAHSQLPLLANMLTGKLSGQEFLSGRQNDEPPFYILKDGTVQPAYKYVEGGLTFVGDRLGQDAIAVVPTVGVVTKYNGQCGDPGTIKRQSWIKEMTTPANVAGYISILDTPGGQADGTPQFADFIKELHLPKVALIAGSAYSAGAWISSGHDMIYAADKYAGFGSIGAYRTIVNFLGYFEKEGIKVTAVYPEISKDKNLPERKALEDDFSLVEKDVYELAKMFGESFAENRGDRIKSQDWRTGKTYGAKDSVSMGIIDGVAGMMEVAEMIFSGQIKSSNQKSKMDISKFKALAGKAAPSAEALAAANAELTTEGITNVTLVEESVITEAERVTTENTELTNKVTKAETDLTAANAAKVKAETDLASTKADLDKAKTQVTELQAKLDAKPGAAHVPAAGSDTPTTSTEDEETDKLLSAMPHNKAADGLI